MKLIQKSILIIILILTFSVSAANADLLGSLSNISLPTLPSLSSISMPTLPSLSSISMPTLPSLSSISMPTLTTKINDFTTQLNGYKNMASASMNTYSAKINSYTAQAGKLGNSLSGKNLAIAAGVGLNMGTQRFRAKTGLSLMGKQNKKRFNGFVGLLKKNYGLTK